MSNRFRPDARLRVRAEFTRVQDTGRRVSTRVLTLIGATNGLGHDRLGIIASRRMGNAVMRNRAKRRLREIFRQGDRDVPPAGQPGLDLVAIARRDLVRVPFGEARVDVAAAIRKLRRTCT